MALVVTGPKVLGQDNASDMGWTGSFGREMLTGTAPIGRNDLTASAVVSAFTQVVDAIPSSGVQQIGSAQQRNPGLYGTSAFSLPDSVTIMVKFVNEPAPGGISELLAEAFPQRWVAKFVTQTGIMVVHNNVRPLAPETAPDAQATVKAIRASRLQKVGVLLLWNEEHLKTEEGRYTAFIEFVGAKKAMAATHDAY